MWKKTEVNRIITNTDMLLKNRTVLVKIGHLATLVIRGIFVNMFTAKLEPDDLGNAY